MSEEATAARIRQLNDEFRRSLRPDLGQCVMTHGVAELQDLERVAVIQKARLFDEFNEENDPYGEHDFGSFLVGDLKLFFKIDYYDKTLEWGSEDPSDPEKTTRVMTLMLASEY
ncbi:DUF3768 domain-containing protein [Akkermansiaceae bacterium]|jgi:hypothetical protein|nr:DUF3768 domain-containing protein [Akkermansiaceae bacterium]MDA7907288.1 DUF3768 domain-containing protein [Akkermansiaceae bacterium]MDA7929596.1 DUF3768 domain-containing protein [Akkermansiaceae bacterium]MDB4465192.1 DUF3768 domain-containing protein [Akkermansiaceae bacterium]MDB4509692.1 DUF3768 domain-containing protein [Akkermansiaceae bacterium]